MAMQKSYIYFLVSTDKDKFKIGKADNVYSRYTQLKRVWGEFDIKNSFQIECNQKNVFDVEHILHFLLEKYNLSLEQKDGYTEWFDYNCFDDAQSLLSSILGHRDDLKIGKVAIPRKPKNGSHRCTLSPQEKKAKKEERKKQHEIYLEDWKIYTLKAAGLVYAFLYSKRDLIKNISMQTSESFANNNWAKMFHIIAPESDAPLIPVENKLPFHDLPNKIEISFDGDLLEDYEKLDDLLRREIRPSNILWSCFDSFIYVGEENTSYINVCSLDFHDNDVEFYIVKKIIKYLLNYCEIPKENSDSVHKYLEQLKYRGKAYIRKMKENDTDPFEPFLAHSRHFMFDFMRDFDKEMQAAALTIDGISKTMCMHQFLDVLNPPDDVRDSCLQKFKSKQCTLNEVKDYCIFVIQNFAPLDLGNSYMWYKIFFDLLDGKNKITVVKECLPKVRWYDTFQ